MPERLYLFVQMEFPWALGPSDGRYLLRKASGAEPEHVVVLGTVGAEQRRRLGSRGSRREARPQPASVPVARATVIDPVPLSAERQARAWLEQLDAERETLAATSVLNRVLFAHRIASANPHVHEVFPAQAIVIRAGWGEGEQVADGRWLKARELPWSEPRGRRRVSALRPQERLAVLLGTPEDALLCEELTLRARLDLDQGRLFHAAIELERAFATASTELRAEDRPDLSARVCELEELRPAVRRAAQAVLPGTDGQADAAAAAAGPDAPGVADAPAGPDEAGPNEEVIRHALGRLEAALRARTATGFGRTS